MPIASIGSPEPPLPRQCSGDGSWRRKTRSETGDFSCAFLSQTAAASREVEKNESAQRAPNPRGASQDHAASRSADRPLLSNTERRRQPVKRNASRSWRRKSTVSWPKRLKSRNGRLWARPSRPTEAIGYPITPQTRRNEPSISATRHWPNMDGKYTG